MFAFGRTYDVWQFEADSGYYQDIAQNWYLNIDTIFDFTSGVDKIDLREFGISFEVLNFSLDPNGMGYFWYDADFDGEYPLLWIQIANVGSLQATDFIFS